MIISEYYKLSETSSTWIFGSIVTGWGEDTPDYIGDSTNAQKLDLMYRDLYSGDKEISPYVERTYSNNEEDIEDTNLAIAETIKIFFKDKWDKLYNSIVNASYDALSNYDITEVETPDLTTENTTQDNVYGFDSSSEDGEPKDKKTYVSEYTGTNTTERTGRDGKVTAQKLLEQEINVRKNLFYEMLFRDLDSILTLRIYD